MRTAAVGHQCVDCVAAGAATVVQPSTALGGRQGSANPVASYALLAVNVVMFVAQMASVGLDRQLMLWPPAVADGQWYRLLTSAFCREPLAVVEDPALRGLLAARMDAALEAISA